MPTMNNTGVLSTHRLAIMVPMMARQYDDTRLLMGRGSIDCLELLYQRLDLKVPTFDEKKKTFDELKRMIFNVHALLRSGKPLGAATCKLISPGVSDMACCDFVFCVCN